GEIIPFKAAASRQRPFLYKFLKLFLLAILSLSETGSSGEIIPFKAAASRQRPFLYKFLKLFLLAILSLSE
ncbi:hypothetical protein CP990_28755, partial [Escherichia coli]